MRKGKFEQRGRHRRKVTDRRSIALALALVLLVGGIVGGTVAWLTARTGKVENVFTTSDINVKLEESTEVYKMIPGWTINKDPKVTVETDSEYCYLFVKVEENGGNVTVGETTYNFDSFIAYAIEEGWTVLDAVNYSGVYYKVIDDAAEKGVAYNILGSGSYTDTNGTETTDDDVTYSWSANQVLTKPEVTKEMMEALAVEKADKPTLSFTVYAVQLWKTNKPEAGASDDQISEAQFTALQAWEKISK